MTIKVTCIAYSDFILSKQLLETLPERNCCLVIPTFRILKSLTKSMGQETSTKSRLMPDFMLRSHFFRMGFPPEESFSFASIYQELLCLYQALQEVSDPNPYLARLQKKGFYEFIQFGRDILSTYRELIQGGKPVEFQLEEIIRQTVHLRWADEKKFELLNELFPRWKNIMQQGLYASPLIILDSFLKNDKTVDSSFIRNYSAVTILDYRPLTSLEQKMLHALADSIPAIEWSFYWQTGLTEYESLKKHFPSPFFDFQNRPEKTSYSPSKISIKKYSTPLNEIAAVKKAAEIDIAEARTNKRLLTEILEDTAIILPDSEAVPSFISFFPNTILNVSVGLPLQKNPVFDLLKRWEALITETISVRGKLYYRIQNLFLFLFSPFIKSFLGEKSRLSEENINHLLRTLYLQTTEKKEPLYFHNCKDLFRAWSDCIQAENSISQAGEILHSLAEGFIFGFTQDKVTFQEGIHNIRKLLTPILFNDHEAASRKHPDIVSASERLKKEWDIMTEGNSSLDFSGIQILRIHNTLLSGLSFVFPSSKHGITVMGYEEAALLNLKTVFLPDLTNKYPVFSAGNIFLNNQLRSQMGLTDQEFLYFTQKSAFENLISRAEKAHISFSQSDTATIPSPFIIEMQLEEKSLEIIHDDHEYSKDFLEEGEPIIVQAPVKELTPFISPWTEKPTSVSRLLQYIRCPYQVYLDKIGLKSEPAFYLDDTLQPYEIGQLAHSIIHSLIPARIDFRKKYPDYSDFKKALDNSLKACLHNYPHLELVSTNYFAFQNVFHSSWKSFYLFQSVRDENYAVMETEKPGKCTYLSRDIYFRPDRLDCFCHSSRYCVLDYKTTSIKPDGIVSNMKSLKAYFEKMPDPDANGSFLFDLKKHRGWDHFLEILFYALLLSKTEKYDIESQVLVYFTEQGFHAEETDLSERHLLMKAEKILAALFSMQENQCSSTGYLSLLNNPDDEEQKKYFRIQAGVCNYCEYRIYCSFYASHHHILDGFMYKGTTS